MEPVGESVYVYGVLAASDSCAISETGVQGAAVERIEHAGLVALVSPLEGRALAAPRELRSHWRVLEQASQQATVLPVRFGTVMESREAVRASVLEASADRLTALLQEFAGCMQLNVKGEYDEERLLLDVVRTSPRVAAIRERLRHLPQDAGYYDRIQMGELVAGEIAHLRQADADHALGALAGLAAAARQEEPTAAHSAFDLAFLVRRDGEQRFSRAVAQLAEELEGRIAIRYVGPLPPYSFADADLGAEVAEWA